MEPGEAAEGCRGGVKGYEGREPVGLEWSVAGDACVRPNDLQFYDDTHVAFDGPISIAARVGDGTCMLCVSNNREDDKTVRSCSWSPVICALALICRARKCQGRLNN